MRPLVTGGTGFIPARGVTGVDACRDGWVGVDLTEGGPAAVRVAPSLEELLGDAPEGHIVGIDMPLGLLASGWRTADREGRALLGPRRSSMFAIPPEPVWQQPSYRAANRLCRSLTGNGFSVQAWGLRRKLLEANAFRGHSAARLYEVHPEVSFGAMSGAPLPEPKSTLAGHALRRTLLAEAGIVIPADPTPRRVAVDVLDAAAAGWTARRIAAGQARVLPDPPQTDGDGREIAIRF